MIASNHMEPAFPLKEGDDALMTLNELCHELRKRQIINRGRRTMYRYANGIEMHGRTFALRTINIAGRQHSTVHWFSDFIAELNNPELARDT